MGKSPGEIIEASRWAAELQAVRAVLREMPLDETVKWGKPFYTHGGRNIVGLTDFKDHFSLWFPHGAALKDPAGKLTQTQGGASEVQREWRMECGDDFDAGILHALVAEALALPQSMRPKTEPKLLEVPPELQAAFDGDEEAASAFERLTPGRQRDYADYISGAKQAATKDKRLEKILPMIRAGVGLNDKYRGE